VTSGLFNRSGLLLVCWVAAVVVGEVAMAQSTKPGVGHARPRATKPVRHSISGDAKYPTPVLPFELESEAEETGPAQTLADAIELAYRTNPALGAQRYELRATDEGLAQALAAFRPTAQINASGGYSRTDTGRVTEANRPIGDRFRSPGEFAVNDLQTQLEIDQSLSTGGRASAGVSAAREDIKAGREGLRGVEGDLLAQVIGAYADVRRDMRTVSIRRNGVRVLTALLDEIVARREAGELTRTDVAQAETQLVQARIQLDAVDGQLQNSRANFAALVGTEPGMLAPEPPLPLLPKSIDAAFDTAMRFNPALAQAIHSERASRARIGVARAAARPSLTLRGTIGTSGQLAPFYGYNQDNILTGRVILTIPLSQGGQVGSQVAQAADRNSADRLRIETARRQVVQNIVNAWNQMVTSRRIEIEQQVQLEAAKVYYEGTYEEYRAGLRSTFDVLFAQNSLRDTQVAQLASRRDSYVAQASLLRQIGLLEIDKIATGTAVYEPADHLRKVEARGRPPWEGAVQAIDAIGRPADRQTRIEQPERLTDTPGIAPGEVEVDDPPLATTSPALPILGTTGAPTTGPRP
jgi:outer membrane protein